MVRAVLCATGGSKRHIGVDSRVIIREENRYAHHHDIQMHGHKKTILARRQETSPSVMQATGISFRGALDCPVFDRFIDSPFDVSISTPKPSGWNSYATSGLALQCEA